MASAKNGRKTELDALARLEVGLGAVPQPGDRGDVRLDHGGQLGRGLQRLDHPLGDQLAGPGHPLRAAAQAWTARSPGCRRHRCRPGPRRGRAGRRAAGAGRRRCGGCAVPARPACWAAAGWPAPARPGRVEHVLLADPPADSGAGHRGQVDPCSAASLRTSGVTYGPSAPCRSCGAGGRRRPAACGRSGCGAACSGRLAAGCGLPRLGCAGSGLSHGRWAAPAAPGGACGCGLLRLRCYRSAAGAVGPGGGGGRLPLVRLAGTRGRLRRGRLSRDRRLVAGRLLVAAWRRLALGQRPDAGSRPAPGRRPRRLGLATAAGASARLAASAAGGFRAGGRPRAALARRAGLVDDRELGADRDRLVLGDRDPAQDARPPARGSRCRPCPWRPRAAARRPRHARLPASASG